MRLNAEEKEALGGTRSILRFQCNWVWPLLFLFKVIADVAGPEEVIFLDALWYVACVFLWKRDVRRLRVVRDVLREASE